MKLKFDIRTGVNRALDLIKYEAETNYRVAKDAGLRQEVVKKYNENRDKINTMPLETAEKLQMYYIGHQVNHRYNIDEIMNGKNQLIKGNTLSEVGNDQIKNESSEMIEEMDQHQYNSLMRKMQKPNNEEIVNYAREQKIVFDAAGNIIDKRDK